MGRQHLILGWAMSVLLVGALALWVGGRLAGDSTLQSELSTEASPVVRYRPAARDSDTTPGLYIPEDLLAPLVEELRGIRAELNALRVSGTDRQPVAAQGSMGSEFERLLVALEGRAKPSSTPGNAATLFVPNPNASYNESLRDVHRQFQLASEDDDLSRVSRAYYFKSEQEILDEFGLPAWMEVDGDSLQWNYRCRDPETDEEFQIYISFQNGRVIGVHW